METSFWDQGGLLELRNICESDRFMATYSLSTSCVSVHKLQQQLGISDHTSLCIARLQTLAVYTILHHHMFLIKISPVRSCICAGDTKI